MSGIYTSCMYVGVQYVLGKCLFRDPTIWRWEWFIHFLLHHLCGWRMCDDVIKINKIDWNSNGTLRIRKQTKTHQQNLIESKKRKCTIFCNGKIENPSEKKNKTRNYQYIRRTYPCMYVYVLATVRVLASIFFTCLFQSLSSVQK